MRPDVAERNRKNNPMRNPAALEKMRLSLTGKKQPESQRTKRSESLKAYYASHPEIVEQRRRTLWEKHTSKLKPGWRKMRLMALKRDGYKCRQCGEVKKRLLVHHKDHQGRNLISHTLMNNDLENLETLCYGCHNRHHKPRGDRKSP